MELWMGGGVKNNSHGVCCFPSWVIYNSLAKSSYFGDLVSFASFVMPLPALTMFPVFLLSQLLTLSTYLIKERVYSVVIILASFRQWTFKRSKKKSMWTLWNSLTNLLMTMTSSPAPNFNFMVKYENRGNQVPLGSSQISPNSFSANSRDRFHLWPN